MNIRIQKRLAVIVLLFSWVFVATNVVAKKPVKPPPDPVAEPNHALAINGYGKGSDIYAVDVDGSNPVRIVRRASPFGAVMVWSPDGTRIVWSSHYFWNLQMVNVDGSNRQEILAPTEEMMPWILGMRNLAPSGFYCKGEGEDEGKPANLLYFLGLTKDEGIDVYEEFYVLDLDNLSTPTRLTNDFERHTTLDVSPNGQFIATWTYDAPDGNWDDPDARLEIRDACQDGLPVISSWTAYDLGQVPGYQFFSRIDWSSTNFLAVSGWNRDVDDEIYLIDLDGPVIATKLIGADTPFGAGVNNRRATWSPDGTQLAFTSDHDVYVYDFISEVFTNVAWFKTNKDIDWRPTWKAEP
jgi:Tol biopolymer transport system component